jgi:outer membrane lipase/esterase
MIRTLLLVVTVIVIGTGPRHVFAQPYRDIFVFGDSLSDTGNIFFATREDIPVSPPYFMGRFSNGPVWVEGLAEMFGLEVSPSLTGGTNFAFGGAETGQKVAEIFEREIDVLIPSIRLQVGTFLASDFIGGPFAEVDPDALYVVWGGPNDLRKAVMAGTTDPVAEVQMAVDDMHAAIGELADAGAEVFLVPNLPDLGLTPESRALGPEAMALATDLSIRFNNTLAADLDALEAEFGITIFRLDVFTLLSAAVVNPAAFGFTSTTTACLQGDPFVGGTPCATPDVHVFWDAIHPTAAAHAILADVAFRITRPPLTITPGEANPRDPITISGAVQSLPVLQVRLRTAGEMIRLTRVTLAFADRMGDDERIEMLRTHLINDTNGNGQRDAGENVLATAEIQRAVETLPMDVMPSLEIPPESEVRLLVTLDVNAAIGVDATTGSSFSSLWRSPLSVAGLAGLSILLGSVAWPRHRCQTWHISRGLLILILGCSLVVVACSDSVVDPSTDDDNNGELTFTVEMPTAGIIGQGTMAGQLDGPAVPIVGSTLTISP